MQGIDPSADELGLDWGEDSIYCESICRPEDVYYDGSDDEDYESSTARKLRYEAAGQRFLEGETPFILTAVLRGPFVGENAGWVNPWQSENCTSGTSQGVRTSPGKLARSAKVKRKVSVPETVQSAPNDNLECHLPSPESLKQASVTEAHPYLEDDELAMVREWRGSISRDKDRLWASTPQGTQSKRKRKAKGSSWLKLLASKRRRTDTMESGSVNTPVPRRSHPPDEVEHDTTLNTSFKSVPDRLPSSALAARRFFSESQIDDWERDTQVASDVDELVEPAHESSAKTIGSQIKRISPCRDVQKIGLDGGARDVEDELSRDKIKGMEAAATLSSPISQRRSTPALVRSADSSQRSLQRQTSKKTASANMEMQGDIEDEGTAEPLPAFETQEDHSFCFKMRSKSGIGDDTSGAKTFIHTSTSVGDCMEISEDSLSELSSPHDAAEKDPARDSKIDTTVAEFSRPTQPDKRAVSSVLSSISSEEFDGFSLSEELPHDPCDLDRASQSSLTDAQDTASVFSLSSEEGVTKVSALQSTSEPDERQVGGDSDEETGEDIDETEEETDEGSDQQSDSQSDAVSEAEVERDGQAQVDDISFGEDEATEVESVEDSNSQEDVQGIINLYSTSSTASTASENQTPGDSTPNRQTDSSLSKPTSSEPNSSLASPSHAGFLLKDSVKRFIPQSSWAKLSHLVPSRHPSPAPQSQHNKSSVGTPKNSALADDASIEDLSSARASPQTQTYSPINPRGDGQTKSTLNTSPKSPPSNQTASLAESPTDNGVTPINHHQLDGPQTGEEEYSRMDVDDPKENLPVPFSQQSPWASSNLSQYASRAMVLLPPSDSPPKSTPSRNIHASSAITSSGNQSPWAETTDQMPMDKHVHTPNIDKADHMAPHVSSTPAAVSDADTQMQDPPATTTPTPPARPSTPEPQFSVKSFASFMSPSPERRPSAKRATWRDSGSRLPSTQGILAAVTKNPWQAGCSQRRVSWAPLPHEAQNMSSLPATPSPSMTKCRQASPPPRTPIAELPTSEDAKFHDHFNAVVRRTNVVQTRAARQRLLPSESQRTVGSPAPGAMAETFLAADQLRRSDLADHTKSDRETEESQDPLDMVEDVFREMGDFLEKWDVDNAQSPQPVQGTQSPW